MCVTTHLDSVATNVDPKDVGGEQVIDFDIDANDDYEIQSCVMVDENDRVVEAVVRFGTVEERPEFGVGKTILYTAWANIVSEVADAEAVEADIGDFGGLVPHLRIERENVEEYGLDTVSGEEFARAVAELAELVETVLRGDDRTIDARIDDWL